MLNPIQISALDGVELSQVRCGGYHTLVLAGNWIGGYTGLASELRAARTADLLTDMEFHVDGTVFKAHKAIVCTRSLRHRQNTLKMDLKTSSVVTIEHVTAQEFATFMEFLYTDSCPIDKAQVNGLEKLANLFGTAWLKQLLKSNTNMKDKRYFSTVPRLADDMAALLLDQDFSDISFDIQGRRIHSHKVSPRYNYVYYKTSNSINIS